MTLTKTTISRILILAAAALAFVFTGSAQAAPDSNADGARHYRKGDKENWKHKRAGKKGKRRAQMLAKYDSNGDGQLSVAEKRAMKRERFKKLDSNGNRVLTKNEMIRSMKRRRAGRRGHGKRGKGKKFGHRMVKRFERLDSNGDGVVSQREFVNAKRSKGKHMRRKGHRKALPPKATRAKPARVTPRRYSYRANMSAFAKLSLL